VWERERERRKEDDHDAPICLPHANPCSRSINLRYAQQPEVTFRWSERARIPHYKCALLVCPHCTETSLIRSSVELSTKIFSPEKNARVFQKRSQCLKLCSGLPIYPIYAIRSVREILYKPKKYYYVLCILHVISLYFCIVDAIHISSLDFSLFKESNIFQQGYWWNETFFLSFYSSNGLKILSSTTVSTLIILIYVSRAANHHIKMISEGSCDTEDRNKLHFK